MLSLYSRLRRRRNNQAGHAIEWGGSVAKIQWEEEGCEPLTVEQYLEPQLHPDPKYKNIVKNGCSFTDLLAPRLDLGDGRIALQDLTSIGRLFSIRTCSTEGRNDETVQGMHHRITHALAQVLPQHATNPWIVQLYVQDEKDTLIKEFIDQIKRYATPSARGSEYSQHWFQILVDHFEDVSRENGLFSDPNAGGQRWRGKFRETRLCIWRTLESNTCQFEETIDQICDQLKSAFAQAGVELIPLAAEHLYEWLTRWFVPAPDDYSGCRNNAALLKKFPWQPNAQNRAISMLSGSAQYDIARAALHGHAPWTWKKPGVWWFRGHPSRFITLDEMTLEPEVGHITAERVFGEATSTLFDKMPQGSIWMMTIVYSPQDEVRDKIFQVRKNSVGDDPAAAERRNLANVAIGEIARGNPIFKVFAGIYIFGDDLKELDKKTESALAMMGAHGLRPVVPRYDPIALDSYIRGLPFGFDPLQDRKPYARRAKLWYATHLARVAPVYGRSTGTGFPGCIFFNRGAEPLTFDPLNSHDRAKNAHSLILGPTGSGKTSLLIYMLMQSIAVHRPRVVLITALPTFGLLCDHCQQHGLNVHRVRIDGRSKVSLPPFRHAQVLLDRGSDQVARNSEIVDEQDSESLASRGRDPLGEMEIQARLMITGGEPNAERKLRRDDLDLIRTAIVEAARLSKSEGRKQTMTSDVVRVLREASKSSTIGEQNLSKEQRQRSARIAGAMHLFCSGFNGELFDREGELWPEADITLVELDLLSRRGYEDRLAVALTGLFSMINNKIEVDQYRERQTIVVIDEAHLLLQNALVSPYINRISAMWRTFGAWLWIATQNIRQFPDQAKELLNQPEWWICLSVDKDEINQISRFKSLTVEQQNLLLAAKKCSGRYTEGVILSAKFLALFRNVPPALALALSQTEKSEKAERAKIMNLQRCSELEAAYEVARNIRAVRLNTD